MKFLILATVVSIVSGSAIYQEGRGIFFQDSNTFILDGASGNKIAVSRFRPERFLDVIVSGGAVSPLRFFVDDQSCKVIDAEGIRLLQDVRGPDVRHELLYDILKKYEGRLDDVHYDELLKEVERYVKRGEVCQIFLDLVKGLDRSNIRAYVERVLDDLYQDKRRFGSYLDSARRSWQQVARKLLDEDSPFRREFPDVKLPLFRSSLLRRNLERRVRPSEDNVEDVREYDRPRPRDDYWLGRRRADEQIDDLYTVLKENYGYRIPYYHEYDY